MPPATLERAPARSGTHARTGTATGAAAARRPEPQSVFDIPDGEGYADIPAWEIALLKERRRAVLEGREQFIPFEQAKAELEEELRDILHG
jgi:hypothetical protein